MESCRSDQTLDTQERHIWNARQGSGAKED